MIHELDYMSLATYITSLYPPIHLQRTATTLGISCTSLLEWCVGSLTSHIDLINMEGIVRWGLQFTVLIHEDLKAIKHMWM